MKKNNYIVTTFFIVFLPISKLSAAFDPAILNVEGVEIVPTLNINEVYDSNILNAESNGDSDFKTLFKGKANASVINGANKYSLGVGVNSGIYASSSADNFNDLNANLNLYQSITRKTSFRFKAGRINTHENRGSGYSKGNASILSEPDKYHLNRFEGVLRYGSKGATGRIVVKLNMENRIFDSRREITKTRDLKKTGGNATFYYHVLPKTSALFELSYRAFEYENNAAYDSVEQGYLAGAKWDMTTITSGTVKAGLLRKKFDNSDRTDFSGFSWQLGARWKPLSYSVVDVKTKGRTVETNSAGDFIDSKSLVTQWTHFWTDKIDTIVSANITKNNYEPNGRSENFYSLALKANYNIRRWANAGVSYVYINNKSSSTQFEYNKNIIAINASLAL